VTGGRRRETPVEGRSARRWIMQRKKLCLVWGQWLCPWKQAAYRQDMAWCERQQGALKFAA